VFFDHEYSLPSPADFKNIMDYISILSTLLLTVAISQPLTVNFEANELTKWRMDGITIENKISKMICKGLYDEIGPVMYCEASPYIEDDIVDHYGDCYLPFKTLEECTTANPGFLEAFIECRYEANDDWQLDEEPNFYDAEFAQGIQDCAIERQDDHYRELNKTWGIPYKNYKEVYPYELIYRELVEWNGLSVYFLAVAVIWCILLYLTTITGVESVTKHTVVRKAWWKIASHLAMGSAGFTALGTYFIFFAWNRLIFLKYPDFYVEGTAKGIPFSMDSYPRGFPFPSFGVSTYGTLHSWGYIFLMPVVGLTLALLSTSKYVCAVYLEREEKEPAEKKNTKPVAEGK
jgi:hypothetical protein